MRVSHMLQQTRPQTTPHRPFACLYSLEVAGQSHQIQEKRWFPQSEPPLQQDDVYSTQDGPQRQNTQVKWKQTELCAWKHSKPDRLNFKR